MTHQREQPTEIQFKQHNETTVHQSRQSWALPQVRAATKYWKEARPLTATVLCFVLFVLIQHVASPSPSPPASQNKHWKWKPPGYSTLEFPLADKPPYKLIKDLPQVGVSALYKGPSLAQYNSPHSRQGSLAIVMPFIASQVDRLAVQWKEWDRLSPPCSPATEKASLILHFDQVVTPDLKQQVLTLFHALKPETQACFESPVFLSADLAANENYHPVGPCIQFYSTFEALYGQYDHFLQMEPDVFPIQKHWLDKIMDQTAKNIEGCEDFWMMGSPPVCSQSYMGAHNFQKGINDMHMNANALYCMKDAGMLDYTWRVRQFYNGHGCSSSLEQFAFDITMFQFRMDPRNLEYGASVMSKFRYTDVILNKCEDPYSTPQVLATHPNTVLVHSKSRTYTPEKREEMEVHARLGMAFSERERAATDDQLIKVFGQVSPDIDSLEVRLCTHWFLDQGTPPWVHSYDEDVFYKCERVLCWLPDVPTSLAHFCGAVLKSKPFAEAIPVHKTYIWSTDLHAAPIACSKPLLEELGAVVHAEVDFGNCVFSGLCKDRLKVFENDDWRGFSLDNSCPPKLKHDFHNAYRNDFEMHRVDLVVCSHPAANCELYMSLNRSLAVYATTRLEFGRNDDNIDWRAPYIHAYSEERWKAWLDSLRRIADGPFNSVLANNLYDAAYIKYFAGIDVEYLPSWCSPQATYTQPSRSAILLGPYRDNLAKTHEEAWEHPILQELTQSVDKWKHKYQFARMGQLYPRYEYSDLVAHPAVVWIPYQVSTMSWFEFYRMNIPLFAPSLRLLVSWVKDHGLVWERVYGHPQRWIFDDEIDDSNSKSEYSSYKKSPHTDPNARHPSTESLEFWLGLCDFYNTEAFPHVQLFDSWEHLHELLDSVDLQKVSARMKTHNSQEKKRISKAWKRIIKKAGPHKELPVENHQKALELIYQVAAQPLVENHALCTPFHTSSRGRHEQLTSPLLLNNPKTVATISNFIPPMQGKCNPLIAAGDGSCNGLCPSGFFRSDLQACVSQPLVQGVYNRCSFLSNEACNDAWLYDQCREVCDAKWSQRYQRLMRNTVVVSLVTLLLLGFLGGLIFARVHWVKIDEDHDHDEEGDHMGLHHSQHHHD